MIMLFHGTDTFRLLRNVQKLRTHAQTKQATVVEYDFDPSLVDHHTAKHRLQDIQAHLSTPLLFGNSQFIVIRRLGEHPKDLLKQAKQFFPREIDREGLVILFLEFQSLSQKHLLYTHLQSSFTLKEQQFPQMTTEEAISYIASMSVNTFNVSLTKDATRHLLATHSEDIFSTWYALHTVINSYPHTSQLETSHIKNVFSNRTPEEKIFSLSQAIFEQNASHGLEVLASLEHQGEEGLKVQGFLLSQLKKALFLKDLREHDISDTGQIGGNPKGHRILERQTAQLSTTDLQSLYVTLIEVDRQVKNGAQDVYPALREFILHASQ